MLKITWKKDPFRPLKTINNKQFYISMNSGTPEACGQDGQLSNHIFKEKKEKTK